MKKRFCTLMLSLLVAALALAACKQVPPVSLNDIPVVPGAETLASESEKAQAPELVKILATDLSFREIGATERVSHRTFRLPKNPINVMGFYYDTLQSAGWSTRWGATPAEQIFDRGSQTLIIYGFRDFVVLTLDESNQ